MADWHINELRQALEEKGWRLVVEGSGDNYKISYSWELRRAGDSRVIVIEFEGLDEKQVLPLHKSYACHVRNVELSLRFSRRGESGSPARARWRDDLSLFVGAIGERAPAHPDI